MQPRGSPHPPHRALHLKTCTPANDPPLPSAPQPRQGRCEPGRGLSGMRAPHAPQHPALPAAPQGSLRGYRGHPRSCSPPGRSAARPSPGLPHPRTPPPLSPPPPGWGDPRGAGDSPPAPVSLLGPPCIQTGAGLRGNCITAAPPRPARRHRGEQEPARASGGHRAGESGTGTEESPGGHRDRHWERGAGPGPEGQAVGWGDRHPGHRGERHQHPGQREPVPAPAGQQHPHRAAGRTGAPGSPSPKPGPSQPRNPRTSGPSLPPVCPPSAEGPLGALLTRSRAGFPLSGSVQRRERRHRSLK